jgi:hypothetical protein
MKLCFECYSNAARRFLSHCYSFVLRDSDRRPSDEGTEPGLVLLVDKCEKTRKFREVQGAED